MKRDCCFDPEAEGVDLIFLFDEDGVLVTAGGFLIEGAILDSQVSFNYRDLIY